MTIGQYYETTLWDGKQKLTSKYGNGTLNGVPRFHEGWDFGMVVGTKLKAPADGTFYWGDDDGTGTKDRKPGKYGRLQRTDGTYDYFFHCSAPIASSGAVKKGQYICKSGNTGNSTAPHLHWERRRTRAGTSHFDDISSILINNTPMDNTILWTFLQKYRPDVCKVYTQANCHGWWAQYGKNEIPVQYDNLFKENENLKQQVANLSSELNQTKVLLATRTQELTEAQKKNEEYLGNIEALEGSLEEQRIYCEHDKADLNNTIDQLEKHAQDLTDKNIALEEANTNQAKTIEDLETKVKNQAEIIFRLEKKLANCEASITNAIETLVKRFIDFIFNLFSKK